MQVHAAGFLQIESKDRQGGRSDGNDKKTKTIKRKYDTSEDGTGDQNG